MALRIATRDDIARLVEIRAAVRENILSDPSRVTLDDIRWFIDRALIFVWEENGRVVGFSAADTRDGGIWALFLDAEHEGQGIGQALFARACATLRDAGFTRLWLTTESGTRAERFYRKAGWRVVASEGRTLRLEA